MCGRFVDPNLKSLGVDVSSLKIDPFAGWQKRFNVKPTQDVLLITPNGELRSARWWFVPSWHKGEISDWKATTFNARLEDAQTKPTFRSAWKNGRCFLPISGYFEWSTQDGIKNPHYFQPAGNEEHLICAALASRWNDVLTVTMMTRAANESVIDLHHRMPVILNTEEQEHWIKGTRDFTSLGQDSRLKYHRVKRLGRDDEGPELIEPLPK
jgi:putative SOS response-associated peptidase YedK